MDRELPEEDRKRIEDIVLAHPKACSIHDLRTRSAGVQIFIEFHLEIDGQMRLTEAHDVTEEIELKLYDAFPTAEVLIHQEPAGIDDDRLDHRLDDTIDPEATGL
jgi:ferrous-iron efflux pump FieF